MKHRLAVMCGAAFLLLGAASASAQAVPRNYDLGTVTEVTQVQVKPGQLNAYMQDLAGGWRHVMEQGKRDGYILSYSVEQPLDSRAGEADLVLVVVYKNLAAYDRPLAEFERATTAQFGSLDKGREAAMHRESMRTILGTEIFRQLAFTQ